jgi:hypothetical protein
LKASSHLGRKNNFIGLQKTFRQTENVKSGMKSYLMKKTTLAFLPLLTILTLPLALSGAAVGDLPANRWTEIQKDPVGARRGSAIRYAAKAHAFFLWGFMNADPELLQEQPLMEIPEYDVVAFELSAGRWQSHLPLAMQRRWSRHLPLAYVPRTYAGITTGSERTVMRGAAEDEQGFPRPDLNMVFDQVTYRPANNSLYYFTGGLTAMYDVTRHYWSDLRPFHSPPPVVGGSLAYDPVHDEIILFGGGHIAQQGPDGRPRGYTDTWVYSIKQHDWRRLPLTVQPPPRMNTRMVCDTKNQVLVLFGGDGQRFYLADTWLFDLKTRQWRISKAPGGPEARAGHFTVYDPETGLVLAGGGYNRNDLTDMWAYDAAKDRWQKLTGQVPTGFYISGDIASEQRVILLVSNTKRPGDRMSCNELFPVRKTYAYRIEAQTMIDRSQQAQAQNPIPKRDPADMKGMKPDPARQQAQAQRLEQLAVNEWVLLDNPGRVAPARTWGSATFDTDREQILYWGGGHCGYGGSDVDLYDVTEHTWLGNPTPNYPERTWNHGVRLAGMTFDAAPWTDHGRKVFAYDPVGKRMILVPRFRLTTGYEPEWMKSYPADDETAPDGLVRPPSSYRKYVTWSFDPVARQWKILGPAPAKVDTLMSTPHGVMGLTVNWPGRLNDAGYQRPWSPSDPPEDNAIFLLRGSRWERVSKGQPSPQNLYEMTSLAYDSKRDQLLLHGGGKKRDELWSLDLKTGRWKNLQPKVLAPAGGDPPVCGRESAYIPDEDVLLIYGSREVTWEYRPAENAWRRVRIPTPVGGDLHRTAGQNRAMIYDPKRGVVLLVLGGRGDEGKASVFALRYRHASAQFVTNSAN